MLISDRSVNLEQRTDKIHPYGRKGRKALTYVIFSHQNLTPEKLEQTVISSKHIGCWFGMIDGSSGTQIYQSHVSLVYNNTENIARLTKTGKHLGST